MGYIRIRIQIVAAIILLAGDATHAEPTHQERGTLLRQTQTHIPSRKAQSNPNSEERQAALCHAASIMDPDPDRVRQLLQKGTDANSICDGNPALVWAYNPPNEHMAMWSAKSAEVMALLIEHGAFPNTCSSEGWTPLEYVASRGDNKLVKLFLKHGARDRTGALFSGIEYADVARTLLNHGASLRSRNSQGNTPLLMAALSGRLETIKLFVSHGASVHVRDKQGLSPIMMAAMRSDSETLVVLRWLVAHGASVRGVDKQGDTPLHLCALMHHSPQVIRELVHMGVNKNARDNRGWTAMMLAAQNGYSEAVQELLNLGADPWVKGKKGETVLTLQPTLKDMVYRAEASRKKKKIN